VRHRDDPERRCRRHHDHGWDRQDHQGRHRRAHGSRDHRAGRRPASASCRGSDEASHRDADPSSHRDGACGSQYRRRSHPDGPPELHRRRRDAARADGRPCPARRRTGCCRASGCRDGGSPHQEPPERCQDGVPAGAGPGPVRDAGLRTASTDETPRWRVARSARVPRRAVRPGRPERRQEPEQRGSRPERRAGSGRVWVWVWVRPARGQRLLPGPDEGYEPRVPEPELPTATRRVR
jgi:hypothetical protein